MTKLKPCPFCGGDAEVRKGMSGYVVMCISCPTDFGRVWFLSEEEIVEMWNRRAGDE